LRKFWVLQSAWDFPSRPANQPIRGGQVRGPSCSNLPSALNFHPWLSYSATWTEDKHKAGDPVRYFERKILDVSSRMYYLQVLKMYESCETLTTYWEKALQHLFGKPPILYRNPLESSSYTVQILSSSSSRESVSAVVV
jgi:hypothetical protein